MATGKDALLRDKALLAELERIKSVIETWARDRELWDDAGFKVPFVHRNEPPRLGEVLTLWFEGSLHTVFSGYGDEEAAGLEEEFHELLAAAGYEAELEDHLTMNISPMDAAAKADYLKLQRWQWIQRLAEKRLFDLHAEVFEHFAQSPETLQNLHWRKFEEFLDSVFRNQGFRTELGPGGNDGGVDLRIYQSESVPEIVTVVQAKRYADTPIKLEAVAALSAIAQMERAPRAMFATTSRYQPKARQFALNTQSRLDIPTLELVDLERMQEWCAEISNQLNAYYASGETAPPPIVIGRQATELTGRIAVASWGMNTTFNTFAVIEADYPHEVILRPIGSRKVSGDGQRGTVVPDDTVPAPPYEPSRILAFKGEGLLKGHPTFWGDRKLFTLWDGFPRHFDICD